MKNYIKKMMIEAARWRQMLTTINKIKNVGPVLFGFVGCVWPDTVWFHFVIYITKTPPGL